MRMHVHHHMASTPKLSVLCLKLNARDLCSASTAVTSIVYCRLPYDYMYYDITIYTGLPKP